MSTFPDRLRELCGLKHNRGKKKAPTVSRCFFRFAIVQCYISIHGGRIVPLRIQAPPVSDIVSVSRGGMVVKRLREVDFATGKIFFTAHVNRADVLHGGANGKLKPLELDSTGKQSAHGVDLFGGRNKWG